MLFVLSAYLMVWVPTNFALLALRALPSLSFRGTAAWLELTVHGIVTAACATAGWMLRARNTAARPLATAALTTNAAATVQSLLVSALPHDIQPGFVIPVMALAVVNATAWVVYLYTSKQARAWLQN